jgi:Putative lumazine-binding
MASKTKYAPGVPASRSLALVLAAAGLATGCGSTGSNSSSDFTSAKQPVAQAVEDLESAARKSDEATICTDLLASDLIKTIRSTGQSCPQAISDALDDADTFDLTVKSVTVSGNSATAVVQSKEKTPADDTFKLVKEGGRWKIASLGG